MTAVGLTVVPDPNAPDTGDFDRLEKQLLVEFSPPLSPDVVRRALLDVVASYQSAAVRTYLPVLIERTAREHLNALVAIDRS
jgi:hypothetical protein